jgi:hypothetical protein
LADDGFVAVCSAFNMALAPYLGSVAGQRRS